MGICGILPVLVSVLLAQDVQITRDGNQWRRVDSGSAGSLQTRVLKVATRGRVIIRGSDGDQITYRLIERVKARSSEQAHIQFGSSFADIKTINNVTSTLR